MRGAKRDGLTVGRVLTCVGAAVCVLAMSAETLAQARPGERNQNERVDPRDQRNRAQQPARQPQVRTPAAGSGEVLPISEVGENEILLDFEGEVNLSAFVDYVSRVLNINIIEDPQIGGESVLFRAPMSISEDQLVPLLQRLLDDAGFSLVVDDLGFYRIVAMSDLRPDFGEGMLGTTRVVPTPLVRPSTIDEKVKSQLGTLASAVRVTPLDELGVLIMTGPAPTLMTAEALINQILEQIRAQELHTFELENVSAVYARSRLIALNGRIQTQGVSPGTPGGGGAPTESGKQPSELGNLQERLYIDQGNTLLFRGSDIEAEELAKLVSVVDRITPLVVRRYVAGSVALQAAEAGEKIGLGPVTVSDSNTTTSRGGISRGGATGGSAITAGEPAASGFTVDVETGSVIYHGTPTQHSRVEELIDEFKKTAVDEVIEIKTYKLLYAKATGGEGDEKGVAEILEELIAEPQERTNNSPFLPASRVPGQAAGPVQPGFEGAGADVAMGLEGTQLFATVDNTIIIADQTRNQVIVKAPAKAQAQLGEIIRDLDQKQPQVQIEARIISVTTSDTFSWSSDVQLNFGQFTFFTGFGATEAGDGSDAFTPRTIPAGGDGLTTGVMRSEFVPIAIQTLETIGKTRTLSTPSILVSDNQPANLTSNREVPFATQTQNASTVTTGQGGTAEAGTVLEVTPRISGGGDVTLELSVELSDFTGAAQNGLQPPVQRDNYNTIVTLPADSTVVIGGFKLDRTSENERKVPVLGSLPLIGALFKGVNNDQTQTTIYVFVTPRVLTDPNGTDLLLLTEGPLSEAGFEPDVPRLRPAVIPIAGSLGGEQRLLPRNDAASASAAEDDGTTLAGG
ncbi:MAG: hypothetical protein AAFX05_07175 [Planctomycetota bacterium]